MGATTEIGWTDSTFNGWIGCAKYSRGCRFCYAEVFERRWRPATDGRRTAGVWGRQARRRRTSDATWAKPRLWNRQAQASGVPVRVFASSLCDVFEDHDDLPVWREDLFHLVEETPWLRWMMLTHRVENAEPMTAEAWGHDWPTNAWLGVTVEGQPEADERLPILLSTQGPAERFVSAEPLLEITTVAKHLANGPYPLSLLIGGGESGRKARYNHLVDAARVLRDDAHYAGVPFFWKQWGEYVDCGQLSDDAYRALHAAVDLGRPHPEPHRLGKGSSGRLLDDVIHDGVVASWAAERAGAAA